MQIISISDNLINEAEMALLPSGCSFDEERRDYIRTEKSLDLLAVPGSGKTTALQAKLYCIAKQKPESKGAGILVLSHTNAAVDEIKNRLQKIVPSLFEYPSAVCTVQEFVDRFLAIPFYENAYHNNISYIDEDRYVYDVERYLSANCYDKVLSYARKAFEQKYISSRFCENNGEIVISNSVIYKEFSVLKTPSTWKSKEEENIDAVKKDIYKMKTSFMKNGALCYDDCYFLANRYISTMPAIINILRKRFPFVFVDEFQDLQQHQIDLIDRVFDNPQVHLERIGDPNQSIYSYSRQAESCLWTPRNVITINKSLRLSTEIARIVDNLVLDKNISVGQSASFKVESCRETNIPPCLILYGESSYNQLVSTFDSLINEYHLKELPESRKYGFHIIGWNAEKKNEGYRKFHLADIFPSYHKAPILHLPTTNARDIIGGVSDSDSLIDGQKAIQDIILNILRISSIRQENTSRPYTHPKLEKKLREIGESTLDEYRLFVFRALKFAKLKQVSECINAIREYTLGILLPIFNAPYDDSVKLFLEGNSNEEISIEGQSDGEIEDGIFKIGTIHSVKGQTHCATLYVDTFYEGYFESQYMNQKGSSHNPLLCHTPSFSKKYAKEAQKMLYVGFSRPTHLLCYACQKESWDGENIAKMQEAGWRVVDISK